MWPFGVHATFVRDGSSSLVALLVDGRGQLGSGDNLRKLHGHLRVAGPLGRLLTRLAAQRPRTGARTHRQRKPQARRFPREGHRPGVRGRNGHLRSRLALGPSRSIGHHGRGDHPRRSPPQQADSSLDRPFGRSVTGQHWATGRSKRQQAVVTHSAYRPLPKRSRCRPCIEFAQFGQTYRRRSMVSDPPTAPTVSKPTRS